MNKTEDVILFPLPWAVRPGPEIVASNGRVVWECPATYLPACTDELQATTTAVNSHSRLLEACKAAYEYATSDPLSRLDQIQLKLLRTAIASVEDTE